MASNEFDVVFKEFDTRVNKILTVCDNNLVLLTKYFIAILSACDNNYNRHFSENALIFFSFIAYEIDALQFGKLAFVAQEKGFKGFISKTTGSFEKSGNKKETSRLTNCCVDNLNNEAGSNSTKLNNIDKLGKMLSVCNVKLQKMADTIVSALLRKNKGRNFKFILNVKFYGGFHYTTKHPLEVPNVSDGTALLRNALDVQKRDLYVEITSHIITPLSEYPIADIVSAVDAQILMEKEHEDAAQLALIRRNAENEIIAQKRDEDRKRKREAARKAQEAVDLKNAEAGSSDVSSVEAVQKVSKKSKVSSSSKSGKSKKMSSDDDEDGFTMSGFRGDVNDDHVLARNGRKKPSSTGDLDLMRDGGGYEDINAAITKNLKAGNVASLKNFLLRGGNVSMTELSGLHGGVRARPAALSNSDEEWNEASQDKSTSKSTRKSQLSDLDLSDCESSPESSKYLRANFIDRESSSDNDSTGGGRHKASAKPKQSRVKKNTDQKLKKPAKSRSASSKSQKGQDTGSDTPSSTDSDAPKKRQRKRKAAVSQIPVTTSEVSGNSEEQNTEDKPRKRDIVGLTEHQMVQFANVNLLPFQLSAAQHLSVRSEQFEVGGQLMSDAEIIDLIMRDADVISKKIDGKFLSFIKQNIMVEVFKDVHMMANVIQFYRAKRLLHQIPSGDHITCVWQEVLKEVASDSINELVTSNQKILARMEQNLLELKEQRRQRRHEENQVIDDDAEKEQNAQDYQDLQEYKNQMKLTRTALEEIEKGMKRRINCIAHSTGAKIICIWAKLNNYQHLLTGNMSKFEKKFLLDVNMPFYSVLSDDLSRKWASNVVVSPSTLFSGIDMEGRNRSASHSNSMSPLVRLEMVDLPGHAAILSSVSEMPNGGDSRVSDLSSDSRQQIDEEDISVVSRLEHNNHDTSTANLHRVHFQGASGPDADDCETFPQDFDGERFNAGEDLSPFSSPVLPNDQLSGSVGAQTSVPVRPSKQVIYTSALLSGTPNGSNCSSNPTTPAEEHSSLWNSSSNSKEYSTPMVSDTSASGRGTKRRSGMFSVSNQVTSATSYLSTVSASSTSSDNTPVVVCESNAAVLFDELKHMSADPATINSMKRFIEVMNGKSPSSNMPVTKEEEKKVLDKAKAKQAKEDAKKAVAAAAVVAAETDAKNAAELLASAAASSASGHWTHEEFEAELAASIEARRVATDSYAIFQKLFLFVCKKHVEVKDSNLSLQFFGQRLVRTMSNSSLLKFLLILLQNKHKKIGDLVIIVLHDKILSAEIKCIFGVAYQANDYFNIIGDGFCVLRSMFACYCNDATGYKMSVADMREADRRLFKSKKSREDFFSLMTIVRDSINSHCGDEAVKAMDKKKLRTTMTLFGACPQLRLLPSPFWGCLDWVAYAPFNCTAFSTNYFTSVPGYAQLHCSSIVPRDLSMTVLPYSVDDINRLLVTPTAPNSLVLEGQHAFVVARPSKEVEIRSFQSVFGMFLGVCVKSLADLEAHHGDDFPLIEEIIVKMMADNAYSLSEAEAKLMTAIVKSIDSINSGDVVNLDDVVICSGNFVPPLSVEAFCESRVSDEGVVDLCDSDTGDVDRTKLRATKRMLAKQEQEITELKFKVEASEKENTFLLRLIGRDPSLMHNPPLEITAE